jgi:hypothetical protein
MDGLGPDESSFPHRSHLTPFPTLSIRCADTQEPEQLGMEEDCISEQWEARGMRGLGRGRL